MEGERQDDRSQPGWRARRMERDMGHVEHRLGGSQEIAPLLEARDIVYGALPRFRSVVPHESAWRHIWAPPFSWDMGDG